MSPVSPEQLYFWMMAFIRAGGLLAMTPVFSGKNIPVPVRVAIAAFLAYAAGGYVKTVLPLPGDMLALILGCFHELMTGLLMGLAVRILFYAIEIAGQIISTEIGLVMSSQLDPLSQNSSTAIGTALFYLGSLLFLLSGAHHAMFAAFLRSFALSPPGTIGLSGAAGEVFVQTSGSIFLIAVQMAAPILATNFVVTLSFAILGKAAPSMNVFSESFAARILAGLTLLGLTMGLTAQLVLSHLQRVPELMLRLIP